MKDSANVSALPGGNRNTDGSFNNAGSNGNWWSATENGRGVEAGRGAQFAGVC
ncbi:MAG: hypothetical protein FWC23_08070 [Chitinispirillia bacterium]|nr:hypothetical protein [Chitinispirillia bacterium]MCL2269128.1 hypothetical protein [Chitinispirillia bacterium]